MDPQAAPFVLLAAMLLVLGAWRPWHGLVVLLAALPFNGLLVNFVARYFFLSADARIALAAWHDALAFGIIAAAALGILRTRVRPGHLELLTGAVLAIGLVYVIVAPHRLTALYAYRTLYEPLLVFAALVSLARTSGRPAWLGRRTALAMVTSGVVAAVFTWWQIYVGGFMYLDLYYHDTGEVLSVSYTATFITQPRGIGTFNSPNEFGAYLAMSIGLLMAPGVLAMRTWVRAWALAALGLALLLSFSRSGWLSTGVIVMAIAVLNRGTLPGFLAALRQRRIAIQIGPPVAVTVVLVALILSSSGAPRYVGSTVGGSEPSAGGRADSAAEGVSQVGLHPLGIGLGTAGPKSVRFGETGVGLNPTIHSETWYLTYAIQVGIPGLVALAILLVSLFRSLWIRRAAPMARAALAIGLGPAAGAVFIPILDDPAVAIPLWAIAAVGVTAIGVIPAWDRRRVSSGTLTESQV
jgi:hypothetical protein